MTSKWITNRPPTIDEVHERGWCWDRDRTGRCQKITGRVARRWWGHYSNAGSVAWAPIDQANPDTPPSDEPTSEWITEKPTTRKAVWVFALTIDGAINVMHHNAVANAWHDNFNGNVFAYLEIEKPEAPNLTPPSRTGDYWIGSDGTVTTVEPDESAKRFYTHVQEVVERIHTEEALAAAMGFPSGTVWLPEQKDDELHDPPAGMYPHEPGTLIQYEGFYGEPLACAVVTNKAGDGCVNAWLTHYTNGGEWGLSVSANSGWHKCSYRITGFDKSLIPEHLREPEYLPPPEGFYPHEPGTLIRIRCVTGDPLAVVTERDAGRGVNAWFVEFGTGKPWDVPVDVYRDSEYKIDGFDPSRIPEHLRVDHKKGAAVLLRSVAESLRKGIKPYPSTLENIASIIEEGETT